MIIDRFFQDLIFAFAGSDAQVSSGVSPEITGSDFLTHVDRDYLSRGKAARAFVLIFNRVPGAQVVRSLPPSGRRR